MSINTNQYKEVITMNKTQQSDYYIKEVEKGKYKIYLSIMVKERRKDESLYNSYFTSEENAIKHIRRLENQDKDLLKGLLVILLLTMLPFVTAYAPLTITLGYSLLIAGLLVIRNKPSQTSIFIKSMGEV